MAQIGPMPGMVISLFISSRSLARMRICCSRPVICAESEAIRSNSSPAIPATCAGGGSCASSISRRSLSTFAVPLGATRPNSARWPRSELMVCVRCRTMSARARQHGIGPGFLGLHGHETHGRALRGAGDGGGIVLVGL